MSLGRNRTPAAFSGNTSRFNVCSCALAFHCLKLRHATGVMPRVLHATPDLHPPGCGVLGLEAKTQ
eukprot:426222-Amphidinium_carterae.1